MLVATKYDLIDRKGNFVKKAEGEKLARKINANYFNECSAKENVMIQETIHEAVRAVVAGVPQKIEEEKNCCCGCNFC